MLIFKKKTIAKYIQIAYFCGGKTLLGFVPRMFQGNSEKRGKNGLSQR